MTNDQADEAFQALHDAQKEARLMYMDLRDAGDAIGAANAKLRIGRLQSEIDNLINKELSDWQAGAENSISALSAAADAAQKAVDHVKKDVSNAQKIVSALAALDKVIGVAIKFIG